MNGHWGRVGIRMGAPIAVGLAFFLLASPQPGRATEPERASRSSRSEQAVGADGAVGEDDAVAGAGAAAGGAPAAGGGGAKPSVDATGPSRAATVPADPAGGARRAPILYVPPSRGHAWRSAGAGTRGRSPSATGAEGASASGASPGAGASGASEATRPRIAVLAPRDHVGRTARPSPTLYWLLSAPTTAAIELTLVDDAAIEPLLRLRLVGPIGAGLHALSLEQQGIVLPPNKVLRWFAALVHDPGHRSRDELAEGAIERVDPPPASADAPVATPEALRAASLVAAEGGLWYDALDALSLALEQAPGDGGLAADRQALLDQAAPGVRLP
ncbi:MAG: DUF928 domain-containing protein [Myxococcota bacterium]